ncbi:MAG: hypothetical protein LBJ78_00210 [Puniceicoccales bacterium]|jgi:hypothetical protein|nr:hypothetical protein [Puniceicoccales bacterium]
MRKVLYLGLILLTLGNIGFGAPKKTEKPKSDAILSPAERSKAIQVIGQLLEINDKTSDWEGVWTPFLFDAQAELTVEEVAQPTIVESIVDDEPQIDELVILTQVGNALQPSGSIQKNSAFYLCVQGNKILREGTVLQANYQGQMFEITIRDIQKKRFTLQLNNYALTFNY